MHIITNIFSDSASESSQEDALEEEVLHCQVERLV